MAPMSALLACIYVCVYASLQYQDDGGAHRGGGRAQGSEHWSHKGKSEAVKMLTGPSQLQKSGTFHGAVPQEDELKDCSWLLALSLNLKFSLSMFLPELIFLQFLSPVLAFEFPITKIGHPPHFLSPVFVSVFEMGPCCVIQGEFRLLGSRIPLCPSLPCSWACRCVSLDILFSSLPHPGLS